MRNVIKGVMALLLVSLFIISCTTVPAAQQCLADSDCVPAQCCHPNGAVNKAYAPECTGVLCTAVCEGPLDCGAGEIKCLSNKCTISSNTIN